MARTDLTQASLGKIAASLKPGQIIAISAFVLTLVTSSFGFGIWLATQLATVDAVSLKSEIAALKNNAAEADRRTAAAEQTAEVLRVKERILGLIAIYYAYRDRAAEADATDEDRKREWEATTNLNHEVMERSKSGTSDAPPSVRVRVGKGIRPSLTFESDGSTLPLPVGPFATAD
jgi:hypothetical protein